MWSRNCPFKIKDDEIGYAGDAFFIKENGTLCGYYIPSEESGVLTIPKEVRIIPNGYKFSHQNIKKLVIKGDPEDEFLSFEYDGKNLEEIVFEDTFGRWWLKSDMFRGCENLRAVTMPKNIRIIPQNMFRGCKKLSHIEIPQSVREIRAGAFQNCKTLANVTLPEELVKIEKEAFRDCSALTEIVIPDGVKVIESEAFYCCSSLKSVSLPASLLHIHGKVFDGCPQLQTIVFRGSKKQWKAVKKGHEETTGSSFQDFSRVGYDYAYSTTHQIPFEMPNSACRMVFEP